MKSNDEFNIFGTIKNGQRLRTGDDRFSSIVFSYATCSHVSVTVTIFRTFVIPKRDELANTGSAMKSALELISGISNGVNAFTCSPTSLYRLRTVIIFRNDKRFHWYRAAPIIPLDSTFAFIFSLSCILRTRKISYLILLCILGLLISLVIAIAMVFTLHLHHLEYFFKETLVFFVFALYRTTNR